LISEFCVTLFKGIAIIDALAFERKVGNYAEVETPAMARA
jgi:hypothetical protein